MYCTLCGMGMGMEMEMREGRGEREDEKLLGDKEVSRWC